MGTVGDFTKTKYYQFLFENHQDVFREGEQFNTEMHQLISQKTDAMAIVLKCHLIVEYYIDELLKAAYPTIKWQPVNLSFSKKLELVNTPGTAIGVVYYPALKKLNTLRNKYAHQLTYELKESDLKEIRVSMDLWERLKEHPASRGVRLVEEFAVWVCSNISILTKGIKKQTPETGLSGYLEWLRQMQEPLEAEAKPGATSQQ